MINPLKVLHKLFILIPLCLIASCSDHRAGVDISDIELDLELIRFDQGLFQVDSPAQILGLSEQYPEFYTAYLAELSPIGMVPGMSKERLAVEMYRFIRHKDYQWLYERTQERFGDMEDIRSDFEDAAKRIVYFFPEDTIQNLYVFVSNFEYAGAYLPFEQKSFCVGLEMYMGKDFEIYPQLPGNRFPGYRIKRFEPRFMLANALSGYLDQKVDYPAGGSFIDEAIYEGKKLYALDQLMPDAADSIKIGYLQGMIEWCESNEENIWAYLVEKDLLFSTDRTDFIQKFFNDGPFTTPFGQESAPRVGAWIGWQMVRAYMARNQEVSLEALLLEPDHRMIFDHSKYKP